MHDASIDTLALRVEGAPRYIDGVYQPGRPWPPPPPRASGISPLVIVLIVVGIVGVFGLGACLVIASVLAAADDEPRISPTPPPTATTATATPEPPPTSIPLDDEPTPTATATAPTATSAGTTGATGTAQTNAPRWFCNASGSVRVCGFANVCNNQMVFGSGFGTDRVLASMQAKNACESMARAKGGSTVCGVSCSLR